MAAETEPLLVGIGHLRPPRVRGSCFYKAVVVKDRTRVTLRRLHSAAGEPDMGRVGPLDHVLHSTVLCEQRDDTG